MGSSTAGAGQAFPVVLPAASATTVKQTHDKLSYTGSVSPTGAERHCSGCKWAVYLPIVGFPADLLSDHPLSLRISAGVQPSAIPTPSSVPTVRCRQPLPIERCGTQLLKSLHQAKCYFGPNQAGEKYFETIKHALQL